MPLQADPTLKFALKNFALKRILNEHKIVQSPYNTYTNKGLPPGPICTPALETIDAVLDRRKLTTYISLPIVILMVRISLPRTIQNI
jgi:UPF0755 protein